jgi:hypothetical protein
MNERIKQLERQAIIGVLKGNDPDGDVDRMYISAEFTKKFAELIVRECLSIVEPTEDSGDEWCVTLKGTAQEIKKHFGVEE